MCVLSSYFCLMFILSLPLIPQQSISQLCTAIALCIFAVSEASFKGETKLLSNSLTLFIVIKTSNFNLVEFKDGKSNLYQSTNSFWHITLPPIIWMQEVANFKNIVLMTVIEVTRANDSVIPLNCNAIARRKFLLF